MDQNTTYTIKKGDTLSGLAKTYNTNVGTLTALNKGNLGAMPDPSNINLIREGASINLPGKNQLVATSGKAKAETAMYSNELDKALKNVGVTNPAYGSQSEQTPSAAVPNENNSDPMMSMLNKMETTSNDSTKAIIASIRAARQNNATSVDKQYDTYKRGLQLLGVQSGMSESSPDILLSHINQAENEHRAKIQQLDGEEAKAIMDAENARTEKNFSLFKEKMAYVRQVKQDKQNEMKNLYDTLTATKGIADIQAAQVYDTLQSLPDADKEVYLQKIAEKYKLPVASLISAVANIKETRAQTAREEARKDYTTYKKSDKSSSDESDLGSIDYTVEAKGRRKLNRNGIDDAALNNFITNLKSGYTVDELFATTALTPRQKTLLQKFVVEQ